MTEALLEVRDLAVSFAADEGVIEAVRGVSFDVPVHKTLAVVGESGSGKTVVSQAILGILPANASITRGSILFRDPASGRPPVDLAPLGQDSPERQSVRGARISIIFQEPMSSLSPVHTIGDQIGEALRIHHPADADELKRQTIHMLDRVGFPKPEQAYRSFPFELSGGLRQRAMIAMALICRPALLIADEPTTALDVTIQAQILQLMKELQAEFGMSILFISHDLGVVANLADEIVVLYRGRVMESGPARELIEVPRHPYLKALIHAVPRLRMAAGERLTSIREIDIGAGLQLRPSVPPPAAGSQDEPLLRVENLKKTFLARRGGWIGGTPHVITAVENVSFEIARGECFGIVGESGSGKTTVSKIIMRALKPDSGSVRFQTESGPVELLTLGEDDLHRFRRHIQYIFQDPFGSLNPRMTIYDIVAEPLLIHGIGTEKERMQRVKLLLAAVGLDTRHLRRYPHSFSGGQRQRVGIARALALEPELLLCDEPVSALDVSVQAQILNLLKDLQAELGLTYLFISHNLAVVKYIAQRIGVMCAGRMVEVAPTESLFRNPQHPYTKALLAAVPEPDYGNLLDLSALMAGKASDPGAWPTPYNAPVGSGRLVELEDGHYVRMQ